MRVLGLDPSLRGYGWAVYDSEAGPRGRRTDSGHDGTASLVVPVARFMHFRSMVNDLLDRFDVQAVGIESPAYGGGAFSEIHFGLMMFSLEALFSRRKDVVLFDPTTVKLLVGKSTLGKSDIQRFVQIDTMSPGVINNNEADAYCIAKFASRFVELVNGRLRPEDLTDTERRVFLERRKKVKTSLGESRMKKSAHVFRENSRFFSFSQVPAGDVNLPQKAMIRKELLDWLSEDSR